jgi:ribosomal protein RSM22 (predicted rRNA methylase)
MNTTNDSISRYLFSYLWRQLLPPDENLSVSPLLLPHSQLRSLAQAVATLSEIYTRNRSSVTGKLLESSVLREAYLAYFLPCNLFRFQKILEEIWIHPKAAGIFSAGIHMLDLGCGPGSQILGLVHFLSALDRPQLPVTIRAVDNVPSNLELSRRLFRTFSEPLLEASSRQLNLETYQGDLSQPLLDLMGSNYNLIVMGNVLNELFATHPNRLEKRLLLLEKLISRALAPQGFLVLLEPALKETSRELLQLRNQLISRCHLHVYAPCVHDFPCPCVAAQNLHDWCHEDRSWHPPEYLQEIDRLTGIRKTSLKYSYSVLTAADLSVRDAFPHPQEPGKDQEIWRVVSEPLEEKGKTCIYLCGNKGRVKATRLHKNRWVQNIDFDRVERGQVILTSGLQEKKANDWRIEKETLVKILQGKEFSGHRNVRTNENPETGDSCSSGLP